MPLGLLAKDSMVNLTELASSKEEASEVETRSSLSKSGESPGDDVMVQVLPEGHNGVTDNKKEAPSPEEQTPDNGSSFKVDTGPSPKTSSTDESGADHADENTRTQPQQTSDGKVNSSQQTQQQPPLVASRSAEHDMASVQSVESKALTANTNTTAAISAPSKEDATGNGSVAESSYASSDAKMAAAKAVGQYSGFSADYHDFESYASYATYSNDTGSGKLVATQFDASYREEVPWWCCFFPWITGAKLIEDDSTLGQDDVSEQGGHTAALNDTLAQENFSRSSSNADDEISTGSGIYGEKLSDKEKQAVIARLRLAEPDATAKPQQVASENTSPSEEAPADGSKARPRKSILKRTSTTVSSSNKDLNSLTQSSGRQLSEQNGKKVRRSLFPTYETKAPSQQHDMHPHFAPMARVVTIKSQKDMSEQEKSQIWWQKPDYEEFRRTGRMITRAMLEGGSEIWLATNQSWQMPNQGKAQTLQHATSLADRHAAFKKGDVKAKEDYEDTRDKWWHKFGHSRRGLEHIASIDEGRQRQANVKASIRSVLEEQRRQRVFHREDPEKLRMVSIQNTTWARDLSLASGASDADCIQKNFDDDNRRTREFYLLKFSRANHSTNLASTKKAMPAFMKPMMTMQMPTNRLDANTTSQIRYRAQKKPTAKPVVRKRSSSELPDKSTQVPIRDEDESHVSSMAKKAAGYASGEEIGNMSAVLTGMGGIGAAAATVGGP